MALSLLTTFSSFSQSSRYKLKKKKKYNAVKVQPTANKQPLTTFSPNTASTLLLCSNTEGIPFWRMALVKGFQFPNYMQGPAQYRLATFNEQEMNSYLKSISYFKSNKKIILPLFMNNTLVCKEFEIQRTETMDSVLQAKYPELMSFKAFEAGNSLNTARIDCDGSSTKFMITYNNKVYYITPVLYNKRTYYACYSKDDPNFIKQSFE